MGIRARQTSSIRNSPIFPPRARITDLGGVNKLFGVFLFASYVSFSYLPDLVCLPWGHLPLSVFVFTTAPQTTLGGGMMVDAIPGWGGVERKEGMEWNEWTGSKAGNVRMVESKSWYLLVVETFCLSCVTCYVSCV